eukprot:COSAG01_NODE_9100_length_2555_cov_4.367264_3_plen_128_part_00
MAECDYVVIVMVQDGSERAKATLARAGAKLTITTQPVAYSVILARRALVMGIVIRWVNVSARRVGAARIAPMLQDATTTLVIPVVHALQMGLATHVHALVAGVALPAVSVTALVVQVRHHTAAFAPP